MVLVSLGPTSGRRVSRVRPCLVVSPDDLNVHLGTCTVAAIASGGQECPFRVPCRFGRRDGHIVLDDLPGPARDIVLLNAGAAIYVADRAATLGEGIERAREVLRSGAAREKLKQLVEFSHRAAGA